MRIKVEFDIGESLPTHVESTAAWTDPQRVPTAIWVQQQRLVVLDQLDCWPGEDHIYRRLRVASGALFTVRFDVKSGDWELHSFEGVSPVPTRDRSKAAN